MRAAGQWRGIDRGPFATITLSWPRMLSFATSLALAASMAFSCARKGRAEEKNAARRVQVKRMNASNGVTEPNAIASLRDCEQRLGFRTHSRGSPLESQYSAHSVQMSSSSSPVSLERMANSAGLCKSHRAHVGIVPATSWMSEKSKRHGAVSKKSTE